MFPVEVLQPWSSPWSFLDLFSQLHVVLVWGPRLDADGISLLLFLWIFLLEELETVNGETQQLVQEAQGGKENQNYVSWFQFQWRLILQRKCHVPFGSDSWYELPFSLEGVTQTSSWWATSIKISSWARLCLTLCFLGTNGWHIHFPVQKMLCSDLPGCELFQASFRREFKIKLRS